VAEPWIASTPLSPGSGKIAGMSAQLQATARHQPLDRAQDGRRQRSLLAWVAENAAETTAKAVTLVPGMTLYSGSGIQVMHGRRAGCHRGQ